MDFCNWMRNTMPQGVVSGIPAVLAVVADLLAARDWRIAEREMLAIEPSGWLDPDVGIFNEKGSMP